jgi:hypothetical protein
MAGFLMPTKMLAQAEQSDFDQHVQDLLSTQSAPSSDSLTNPLGTQHDTSNLDQQAFDSHVTDLLRQQPDMQGPPNAGSEADFPSPSLSPSNPLPAEVTTPEPAPAPPAPLPAPNAPVTTPLVRPLPSPTADPTAMLDRQGVINYVHQRAADYGLDPAAVLAVANQEGLNTAPGSHWQLGGESNISFGPPSWYGNGAGSAILQQHGPNAAAWSWTPPGIEYWLGQVAQAAKGLTGNQAISAIVNNFERPREDLAAGEIKKAQQAYANFQQGGQELLQGAGNAIGSAVSNVQQAFDDHVQGLLGGAGQSVTDAGNAIGGAVQSFMPTQQPSPQTVDLRSPQPPPVIDLTQQNQQQKPFWQQLGDTIGSAISNGLSQAMGSLPNFADSTTVGPQSPIGQRVQQRVNEGGLNPGDFMQAETDVARAGANAIVNASPELQRAAQQTGSQFRTDFSGPQSLGPALIDDRQIQQTAARYGVSPSALRAAVTSFNTEHPSVTSQVATGGVQGYLGAAGGELANAGNPLAFVVDPQGQLQPLGIVRKTPAGTMIDHVGDLGPLGESAARLPTESLPPVLPATATEVANQGVIRDALSGPPEGQLTRQVGNRIVPVLHPEEVQTQDLLQAMLSEAQRRGAAPEQVSQIQQQLDQLYAPTELAAGISPQAVGRAIAPAGRAVRTAFNPASAAPQAVQDALNVYDGTVRQAQAVAQREVILGHAAGEEASKTVGQVIGTARKQFLNDVANVPAATREMSTIDWETGTRVGVPKPQGWVNGGTLAPQLSGMWVSPEVATVVRNTLNHDITVPGLEGLAKLSGLIKQIGLTGSPFHFIQEELQAVRLGASQGDLPGAGAMVGRSTINAANPGAFKRWLTDPMIAPIVDRAAKAGVTLGREAGEGIDLGAGMLARATVGAAGAGAGTYTVQKGRGASDEDAMKAALVAAGIGAVSAGPIGSLIGPAVFERQIPTLKVIGFKVLTDSGLPDAQAAQMVNNTFGGQNLTRMARDPNFQGLLRSVVLAPDWWESWARNVGSAIPGMPVSQQAGDAARKYVLTTVVSAGIALEGLNWLFTGHFTNENAQGRQLDLEIPTDRIPGAPQGTQGNLVHIDILGPLRPMAQLVTSGGDIGAFGRSRLSAPAGLVVNALQNKNPATGGPLVGPGTPPFEAAARYGQFELGQVMPAGAQGVTSGARVAGPLGAVTGELGLRTSSTAKDPIQKPVQTEIKRLQDLGYSRVSLPYPDKSFIVNGAQIDLTADERQQLAILRGQIANRSLEPLIASPTWNRLSNDQKANQVQLNIERATEQAKVQMLNALPADQRMARLKAGVEVRGRKINQQPAAQSPFSLPSFMAPTR